MVNVTQEIDKRLADVNFEGVRGLEGVKEATVKVGDLDVKVAVASGLAIPLAIYVHRALNSGPTGLAVADSHILFVEEFVLAGSGAKCPGAG